MARQVRLTDYPDGQQARSFWEFSDDGLPALNENEIKLRIDWVSVDPGMSGWITNEPSDMPPARSSAVILAEIHSARPGE